jgi:hypothetical protein
MEQITALNEYIVPERKLVIINKLIIYICFAE